VTLDDSLAVVRYVSTVKIEDMLKAVEEEGYLATVISDPVDVSAKQKAVKKKKKKPSGTTAVEVKGKSLAELDPILTKSAYQGTDEQLQVELTLVTPEYLKALYAADRKAGKTKEEFSAYKKKYRITEALPFRVKLETHTVDTSPFDLQKAAVLIDDRGNQVAAIGWQELPSPMPAMASHHRRGILFFPKVKTKSLEVVLKGIGAVSERRFKWDLSATSAKK
jgi:hypothetical protein